MRLWVCCLLVELSWLSWLRLVRLKVSMLEAGGPGQYWGWLRGPGSHSYYTTRPLQPQHSPRYLGIIWLKPPALRLGEIPQHILSLFNNILITITYSAVIAQISAPPSPQRPPTEFINSSNNVTDVYNRSLSSLKKICSKVGRGQLHFMFDTFYKKNAFCFSFPWKADIEDIHLCCERKANFM